MMEIMEIIDVALCTPHHPIQVVSAPGSFLELCSPASPAQLQLEAGPAIETEAAPGSVAVVLAAAAS